MFIVFHIINAFQCQSPCLATNNIKSIGPFFHCVPPFVFLRYFRHRWLLKNRNDCIKLHALNVLSFIGIIHPCLWPLETRDITWNKQQPAEKLVLVYEPIHLCPCLMDTYFPKMHRTRCVIEVLWTKNEGIRWVWITFSLL